MGIIISFWGKSGDFYRSFKVYMVDTGLLCSKFGISANAVINNPHSFEGFKGALAENYVMQDHAATAGT